MSLQAIRYARGSLELLDQRQLPQQFVYLPAQTPATAWQYIKEMVVRGAPAIGVCGVLAIATDLVANKASGATFQTVTQAVAYIKDTLSYLVTR
jgi:methylthioribose-1-phosphate isomerase